MNSNIRILTENDKEGYGALVEHDSGYVSLEMNHSLLNENKQLEIKGDSIFIKCILQKANTLNRNGRVYPFDILKREIDKYISNFVSQNSAIGESDHPSTLNVSLMNIPYRIVKIWWEGETVYGELEIFLSRGYVEMGICSFPGDFIGELLRRGVKLGISSRGLGSVKTIKGQTVVQGDFELVCFDLVASPSTPNAYLFQESAKVYESVDIKTKVDNDLTKKLKKFLSI